MSSYCRKNIYIKIMSLIKPKMCVPVRVRACFHTWVRLSECLSKRLCEGLGDRLSLVDVFVFLLNLVSDVCRFCVWVCVCVYIYINALYVCVPACA